MIVSKEEIEERGLRAAVRAMMKQHDALRSRFIRREEGWRAEIAGEEMEEEVIVEDYRGMAEEGEQEEEAARKIDEVHRSLRLSEGRVMSVLVIRMRGETRVVMIIHHLVVDGVSWRILVEDLVKGYEQARKGEEIRLGREDDELPEVGRRSEEVE